LTQGKAQETMVNLNHSITKLNSQRASLGATQNRLSNTIQNLQIQAENLQASESQISDVDVAQEMTSMVGSQIIAQSATAMLAQANSLPKMALQLIQG
jgi:flagellin-like hook-associated protein FlgL